MAAKESKSDTERRIHVLPIELLVRVRAYQAAQGLPSEVEAVRRLLTEALQAREGLDDLMRQIHSAFSADRNLRGLVRTILSDHIQVRRIDIAETEITFVLNNKDAGSIDRNGEMKTGAEDDQGFIHLSNPWPKSTPAQSRGVGGYSNRGGGSSWASGGAASLDDEIPF